MIYQDLGNYNGIGECLYGLSILARSEENMAKARALAEEALIWVEKGGNHSTLLHVLILLAEALWYEGETARAQAMMKAHLPRSREYGGDVLMLNLNLLVTTATFLGEYEEAKSLLEEDQAISRALGKRTWPAHSKTRLGAIIYLEGELPKARMILEEAIQEAEMLDADCLPWQFCLLGNVALQEGRLEEAELLVEKCIIMQEALNVHRDAFFTYLSRGKIALARSDHPRARDLFQQSLSIVRDRRMIPEVPARLEALAQVAAATGELKRAAYLLAAASALRDRLETPLPPVEREGVRVCQEKAHLGVNPLVIQEAWNWGEALTVDEMIAFGLSVDS